MFLVGFCFNLLVTGLYYASAGMCYGIKHMFYNANNVSNFHVITALANTQQRQTTICKISNKNNNISKMDTAIINGNSNENTDINTQKLQLEVSTVNEQEHYKLDTVFVSLRTILTEGMERHDKTGRISKMFADNVEIVKQYKI